MPRRHSRIRSELIVRYGVGNLDRTGVAETISEGGIYLSTNEPYKVGTQLLLQIEFNERSVLQRGEVVWAIKVPEHQRDAMVCGMGISFVATDPAWPQFFRRWTEQVREMLVTAADI